MVRRFGLLAALLAVCASAKLVWADYTLFLKNGRRITVQSYREDGGMIRFPALGGEMGIPKEQVQAIRKAGESEQPGFSVVEPEPARLPRAQEPTAEKKPMPSVAEGKAPAAEKDSVEQKAIEEKEYQKKIAEITQQLKEKRERYSAETRGTKGPDPEFFTSEEAFRGHQEDLMSRLRAAQGQPPETARQKALSELRNQINQLEIERQRLIDEMKQKGFDTGSLFLE